VHGRVGRDEPEQCRLGAQVLDVRTALAAPGEHEGRLDDHLAAIVNEHPPLGDGARDSVAEAHPVGEGTYGMQPEVRHHARPTGFHFHARRAGTVHFGSALLVGDAVASRPSVFLVRGAFPRTRAGQVTRTRE
jgi:hypothetical protein